MSATVRPIVSVVVVNWNTRQLLIDCLRSLESASLCGNPAAFVQGPVSAETIVIDNASTDGSSQIVRERFGWVKLIENRENIGFARANSQGVAVAKSPYLLLLNSDTLVHKSALDALVAFMTAHARAGACGPRLFNADSTLQPSTHPMLTPAREFWRLMFLDAIAPRATYPMHCWSVDEPRQVEVIKGACLMLRREALDQVGLLDESYFMYTEEVDLCYRLAQAGWELWWVPQAQVIHYGEASSRQAREDMYIQLYRSKVQFYRKFGGERRANEFKRYVRIAYLPRLLLATAARPLSRRLGSQAKTYKRLLAELKAM